MASPTRKSASHSQPPPFPEGWYFVASREALRKAVLIQKTWMGKEIVAWCDDSGRVCVARAFCPHLGSSLGPEEERTGLCRPAGLSLPRF